MSEHELLERIIQELDKRIRPSPVPIEVQLWSTKEIGEYMQRPAQVIRDRVVGSVGFPEPIRLPNADGHGKAHPRWKAVEVIQWTESHRNRKAGRPRKSDY